VAIRQLHKDNLEVYGARKIHAELIRKNVKVARCTVERLMRAEGLRGITRDKTRKTTVSHGAETHGRPTSSSGGSSPRLPTSCGWRT
jgi:putative transposase